MTSISGQLELVHDIRVRARRGDVFTSQKNRKIQVVQFFTMFKSRFGFPACFQPHYWHVIIILERAFKNENFYPVPL